MSNVAFWVGSSIASQFFASRPRPCIGNCLRETHCSEFNMGRFRLCVFLLIAFALSGLVSGQRRPSCSQTKAEQAQVCLLRCARGQVPGQDYPLRASLQHCIDRCVANGWGCPEPSKAPQPSKAPESTKAPQPSIAPESTKPPATAAEPNVPFWEKKYYGARCLKECLARNCGNISGSFPWSCHSVCTRGNLFCIPRS